MNVPHHSRLLDIVEADRVGGAALLPQLYPPLLVVILIPVPLLSLLGRLPSVVRTRGEMVESLPPLRVASVGQTDPQRR